jgi:hypothetical protein
MARSGATSINTQRLLFPKADVQSTNKAMCRWAAFGQKQPLEIPKNELLFGWNARLKIIKIA